MNWDDYRYFLAVARTGQLSAAGKKMGVDHATVSRRIKSLEKTLKTKLFDSSPSGYQLTDDGHALLPTIERMESASIVAETALHQDQDVVSGAVRLGVPDGVAAYIVVDAAKELCETHPKLDLQLVAMPRKFSLSKREVDFAISISPPDSGRTKIRKIADYKLHLYGTKTYLDAHQPILKRSDLKHHCGIGYVPELLHDNALDYLPFIDPDFKLRLTSTSVHVQLQAILNHTGIGIVHDFMAKNYPDLEPILKDEISVTRSFWFSIHEDYAQVERIRICADAITRHLKTALKEPL